MKPLQIAAPAAGVKGHRAQGLGRTPCLVLYFQGDVYRIDNHFACILKVDRDFHPDHRLDPPKTPLRLAGMFHELTRFEFGHDSPPAIMAHDTPALRLIQC
jgi:hypothetical protein